MAYKIHPKFRIWILIADHKTAHVYFYRHQTKWKLFECQGQSLVHVETIVFERQYDDRMKKNLKDRQNIIHATVAFLERICSQPPSNRLVLVAPASLIGEVRRHMPYKMQKQVKAVLPKELTNYRGDALLSYLQDTLNEAQFA